MEEWSCERWKIQEENPKSALSEGIKKAGNNPGFFRSAKKRLLIRFRVLSHFEEVTFHIVPRFS